MKKLLTGLITASLVFAGSPVVAADWYPEYSFDPSNVQVTLIEGAPFVNFSKVTSQLYKNASDRQDSKGTLGQFNCKTMTKNPCIPSSRTDISGDMVAPVCGSGDVNCIRGFFAETSTGIVEAQFLGYQNEQTVPPNPRLGIRGRGKSTSMWNIPGVANSAGATTYAVTVSYRLSQTGQSLEASSFRANITPYIEQADERAEDIKIYSFSNDGLPWVTWDGPVEGCAWVKKSVCGKAVEFGSGARFGLDLRFENQFTNWFGARMTDIDLSVKELSNNSKSIRILASPVQVPIFSHPIPRSIAAAKLKSLFGTSIVQSYTPGSSLDSDSSQAMAIIDSFRSMTGDKAAATMTFWSFSNIDWNPVGGCARDPYQILGLVSTNAMSYQREPPKFKSGFLNYEVSGLHLLPSGEPALGTYDLLIRSSVASCLYGFGKAPLNASVTVVNNNGTKVFSTTTVSEKDGWLKLSAKGFTFSKKIIKVKITKKKKS